MEIKKNFQKVLFYYVLIAVLSLYATLWLGYAGEEAVYTISSYEMWYYHHYWVNNLYGIFYGRPPGVNWLIIPLTKAIGWIHVLIASRFVTASATALTALGCYLFVKRLTKNRDYALLSCAIYLTGDLLFVRGWLAYTDSLLSFFVFLSIAFLWLGVEEKRNAFLILGVMSIIAGFLSKALSPYWIYGLAGLVLLVFHPNRKFLLKPSSFMIHAIPFIFVFIFDHYTGHIYFKAMWAEVFNTAFKPTLGRYFYQILVIQPSMLLLRLLPVSLVALFAWKNINKPLNEFKHEARLAFWIAFLNFAVCWFAPRWPEPRYYMPVLPFMAMSLAYIIWNSSDKIKKITLLCLMLGLFGKLACVGYFYYRYDDLQLNYKMAAKEILQITGKSPLRVDYFSDQSAPVEKAAIYVDLLRYPKRPLIPTGIDPTLPLSYDCSHCYVIGQILTARDKMIKRYSSGKRAFYLFYRT